MRSRAHDSALTCSRILSDVHWTLASLADEFHTLEWGFAVRTRSLPLVWSLNELRLSGPLAAEEVHQLAEEHQGDLFYRHVVVEDETSGSRLRDALVAAGWKSDREVLMALAEASDRRVDTSAVVELSGPQMLDLMRRWDIEEHPGISNDALDQLQEYTWREGQLWNETCFGVLDSGGNPASLTKLRAHEGTGWVEDVYTVPEARGLGYARVLVTHAAHLARSANRRLTFITADDNDWPKHLYEAVGFRPVGIVHTFHRDVRSDTGTRHSGS